MSQFIRKHHILGHVSEKSGPFNNFYTKFVLMRQIVQDLREFSKIFILQRLSKAVETNISILGTNNEKTGFEGTRGFQLVKYVVSENFMRIARSYEFLGKKSCFWAIFAWCKSCHLFMNMSS